MPPSTYLPIGVTDDMTNGRSASTILWLVRRTCWGGRLVLINDPGSPRHNRGPVELPLARGRRYVARKEDETWQRPHLAGGRSGRTGGRAARWPGRPARPPGCTGWPTAP